MRKFLALLLLIALVAFPSIAGAINTSASGTADVSVNYLQPISMSVEVPAGTIYVANNFTGDYVLYMFWLDYQDSGWNHAYTECDRDIRNRGLSVFKLTGSPNQQVEISVDEQINANNGSGTLQIKHNRICLGSDNTLLSSSNNCCSSGVVSDSNSVTATIPSDGTGYFAIRPVRIHLDPGNARGTWTATITVTADYQ